MAFQRFAKEARSVVDAAVDEASTDGRRLVEAEHLLLALASDGNLQRFGLDHEELAAALAREEEQSLASVGVIAGDVPARSSCPRSNSLRLATSAKLAIERALKITVRRGQRQITAQNLLLGVISAEQGRVPRALELAGVDVHDLRARLRGQPHHQDEATQR